MQHDLNQKSVAKWHKRAFVHDAPMGPMTVQTANEEATVVAFRKHTLLPLDDFLYAPAGGNRFGGITTRLTANSKITLPPSSKAAIFVRPLKTLRGLASFEAICTDWAYQPDRFRFDLVHLTSGLNT